MIASREYVYILRAVLDGGRPPVADTDFRWPMKAGADVVCPDWDPEPRCGGGLHGWAGGEVGDLGGVDAGSDDLRWLVFRADPEDVVELGGKVKARAGRVVYAAKGCGVEGRMRAVAWLEANGKAGAGCAWIARTAGDRGTATAGDWGTATAGYSGTATAGYSGTATAGDWGTATAGKLGTATAGYSGTATAGDWGTATAGYSGTATAGDRGEIKIRHHDGERYRWAAAYVGECGIKPNTPYQYRDGAFVEVSR